MDWDYETDDMHWNACRANTRKRKAVVTLVSGAVITAIVLLILYYSGAQDDQDEIGNPVYLNGSNRPELCTAPVPGASR